MPGAPSSRFPPESPHWVSLGREALVGLVAEPAQGSTAPWWLERARCLAGASWVRVSPRVSAPGGSVPGARCSTARPSQSQVGGEAGPRKRRRGRPGLRVRAGGLPPGGRGTGRRLRRQGGPGRGGAAQVPAPSRPTAAERRSARERRAARAGAFATLPASRARFPAPRLTRLRFRPPSAGGPRREWASGGDGGSSPNAGMSLFDLFRGFFGFSGPRR